MKKQNTVTEKLTDKAFSRLVITSILGIVICIACLCSTTFAWFADSAPSNGNSIRTAESCGLVITVSQSDTVFENIEQGVELHAGVYTVTLTLPPDTASGYCVITAGDTELRTDYIARHSECTPQTVTYSLVVTTTQTVKFTARWGIYTGESHVNSEGVIVVPPKT